MARKNPNEQIAAAREMLARAQARQRQADTRTKIVTGALCLNWLRKDVRAAHAFLAHIQANRVRDQDAELLAELFAELRAIILTAQQQSQANHVS